MAATAKKPTLKLVQPNLEEMERVLTEAAKQMAPMISRGNSTKQKFEAEVKGFEAELEGVRARRDLARRHAEALDRSFQAEEDDILRAIGLHTGGLTSDTLQAAE